MFDPVRVIIKAVCCVANWLIKSYAYIYISFVKNKVGSFYVNHWSEYTYIISEKPSNDEIRQTCFLSVSSSG